MSNSLSVGSGLGKPFWHIGDILAPKVNYPWTNPLQDWAPNYQPLVTTSFIGGSTVKEDKKVIQMELLVKIAKATEMSLEQLLELMEEIVNG